MDIQIAGIQRESIVDGPGFRYVVFVQGCPHLCKGCHNPQALPFDGGEKSTVEELFNDFMKNPLHRGITFSGGEPFSHCEPLYELGKMVHSAGKDVVIFTGFTFEQLMDSGDSAVMRLLDQADILIDGPFILKKKGIDLAFRGSENQRIIDMRATRKSGEIILIE